LTRPCEKFVAREPFVARQRTRRKIVFVEVGGLEERLNASSLSNFGNGFFIALRSDACSGR
jgi:hypothetical protein